MRTTIDLDKDVLEVAKSLAVHRRKSLGYVISEMLREKFAPAQEETEIRNGLRVIHRGSPSRPVTLDTVNRLRDELP